MPFGSTLYKADTWLKRTKNLGPVGVRFRQVSLYVENIAVLAIRATTFDKEFRDMRTKLEEKITPKI